MDNNLKKVSPHPLPTLQRFLDKFKNIFHRSDTLRSAERYITGLLSDIPYKNCGMIAENIEGTSAQALQEFMTNSTWNHNELNHERVDYMLQYATKGDGALIFDDTGFEKKGKCSVGVARQYSGTLGKIGNCQIAVSCQYTDTRYTWPVNSRLYLPECWSEDKERLEKAKVPDDIGFKTKIEIALDLLDEANELGVKHSIVGADSFYGSNPIFLEGLEKRNELYAVTVHSDFTVRFEQDIRNFTPPEKPEGKKRGRPRIKPETTQLPPQHKVSDIMGKIPQSYFKAISWRDGTKGALKKDFAFLRVRWSTNTKMGSPGWLILERPLQGESGDIRYHFSNLPIETPDVKIVEYLHRRHTIERFYQDAKDELGLDQYEGRRWHGFHRHFTMVMLAYSWLTLQRRFQDSICKEYEVVVDKPVIEAPSFSTRELFFPKTIYY